VKEREERAKINLTGQKIGNYWGLFNSYGSMLLIEYKNEPTHIPSIT
jgi:hypothetical protein